MQLVAWPWGCAWQGKGRGGFWVTWLQDRYSAVFNCSKISAFGCDSQLSRVRSISLLSLADENSLEIFKVGIGFDRGSETDLSLLSHALAVCFC